MERIMLYKKTSFLVWCEIAEANMLYLETPIGVGFSYSTDTSSYEAVGDKITGKSLQLYTWIKEESLSCQKHRNH